MKKKMEERTNIDVESDKKIIKWVKNHKILTGIIIFFLLAFLVNIFGGDDSNVNTPNVSQSPQQSSQDTQTNLTTSTSKPTQETQIKEEECDLGYSDEYKCDGKVIQRKWINLDCNFDWFYYLTCSYGCENGECIYEPVQEPEEEEEEQVICGCSSNIYNCANFSTHVEAQACYEYCGGLDNDIHWLDGDDDGVACEGLP